MRCTRQIFPLLFPAIVIGLILLSDDETRFPAEQEPLAAPAVQPPPAPQSLASSNFSLVAIHRAVEPRPTVVIPAGERIHVRTLAPIPTKSVRIGETFIANLDKDLKVDGEVLAPEGSRAAGRVVALECWQTFPDGAQAGLQLTEIQRPNGESISLRTNPLVPESGTAATIRSDAELTFTLGRPVRAEL